MMHGCAQAERDALRADCPRHGLRATFRGRPVKDVAQTVVGIAAAGLKRRGMGEESLLAPLQVRARTCSLSEGAN